MDNFLQLGILGGGQLAQMITQAALPIGVMSRSMVKRWTDALPGLGGDVFAGDWDAPGDALAFARTVDVVTLENEFVNPASLDAIEQAGIPLYPSMACIRLIQDKWHQKQAMVRNKLPVVPSQTVQHKDEVSDFAKQLGWPVVLKRRHQGYDGKGNATIRQASEVDAAWSRLAVNDNGLYVEAFCPFERELAVMVTRSRAGEVALYPVVDTVQKDHICHIVTAPSYLPPDTALRAQALAQRAVEAIEGIGTIGVEMFLTESGDILINELAPRVHNSGHYTIEGCVTSQFENHVRAVCGLPLGSTRMTAPFAAMVNVLGQGDGPGFPAGYREALAIEGAHIHIYGKNRSARGRKMGHVTALGNTRAEALEIAQRCAALLRFG